MQLPRTESLIRAGIDAGLHVGAQWSIWHHGKPVSAAAIGLARPDVAMDNDSINLWMSTSKPFTAVAIAQLWERNRLTLDDAVARYLPAFGTGGKDAITIRHLLTHTSGIRPAAYNTTAADWDAIIQQICDARLEPNWIPGITAGYHTASSWFILGELVARIDGRRLDRYLREAIFEPLGMDDVWLGMPADVHDGYGSRIATLYKTANGRVNAHPESASASAEACGKLRPGANGRGPAGQIVRFYQMLLNGGSLDGVRILLPQTVEAITARQRAATMDLTFRRVVDWGLGVLINSAHYSEEPMPYGFGKHASRRTYGHGGAESSVAWVDPEHALAGALLLNGTPGDAAHQQRIHELMSAIYEDLQLTS